MAVSGRRVVMRQTVAVSRLLIKREGLDLQDRNSVGVYFDLLTYLPWEKLRYFAVCNKKNTLSLQGAVWFTA